MLREAEIEAARRAAPIQVDEETEPMNALVPTDATSIADIPIRVFDDEPRILDSDLGDRLGMTRPDHLRVNIIEKHRSEIEAEGRLYSVRTNPGPQGGRPGLAYYLTMDQAIATVMLSRAPNAGAARVAIRRMFSTWQKGHAVPALPGPVDISPEAAAAIGGIVKVVVNKQLKDHVDGALEEIKTAQALALEEIAKLVDRAVAHGAQAIQSQDDALVTAHEVVGMTGYATETNKYSGLAGQVASRLSKYCARHCHRIGIIDLRPGEKLAFPREAALAWLDSGGRGEISALLNAHASKKAGQGTLRLSPR